VNPHGSVVGRGLVEKERNELERARLELVRSGEPGFIGPMSARKRSWSFLKQPLKSVRSFAVCSKAAKFRAINERPLARCPPAAAPSKVTRRETAGIMNKCTPECQG